MEQNWYCSLPGHDYFCEVHEDFIEDDFNLTGESANVLYSLPQLTSGLQSMVPFWKEALEMVLDVEPGECPPFFSRHLDCLPHLKR